MRNKKGNTEFIAPGERGYNVFSFHQSVTDKLCAFVKKNGITIVVFTEFHPLKFTFPWFIENIVPKLNKLGFRDLVTEIVNVEVTQDENWAEITKQLSTYPSIERWRATARENREYDQAEYWREKVKWLRERLDAGAMPYLQKNLAWLRNQNDILWLVIRAIELNIRLYGVSTPDMNERKRGGLPFFISMTTITDLARERIKELRRQGKKVAGYFGKAHGEVKPGQIYVDTFMLGSDAITINGEEFPVEGIFFKGLRFSVATDPAIFAEKYMHVSLLVGSKDDIISLKDRHKELVQRAPDDVLNKGKSNISFYEEEQLATIIIPERNVTFYSKDNPISNARAS